ncbi:dihydroxyacetone kinase subunit DhaK [Salibacterium qingdaonense]|uniref:Dihydroxyacetone kinase DhaK subunit n=1 Tax=Salibacterium qingdaonense TaxID=266892 RepID=A0A1I4P111_9BACI|nr:dihydroxyacetone kinase subunit DhaK [Salibacterium qingdaonense]SFM21462.1 dihydroxyacetone kinase DhaK subunit [Salibacterium qingdaonense]
MKKIMNQEENVMEETLQGFIDAYAADYERVDGVNGVIYRHMDPDKVSVITGGGAGHEPLFVGFAGKGLASGAAMGNVFAAPNPDTILEVTKAVENKAGVLYIYGNYAGDVLNFDMASELAEMEDIETRTVKVSDDVASASKENKEERRGIAGDVFVIKAAGAAADAGLSLDEVTRIAAKANENTHSIGVGISPGTSPGKKAPMFELPDNQIEFGLGIHGEKGIRRAEMMSADDLADEMLDHLLADAALESGDEAVILLNGLGSTTLMELLIVNQKVHKELLAKGITVYDTDVNSYCTTQEMGGFSITILKLDEELKTYYDAPAHSPYYHK